MNSKLNAALAKTSESMESSMNSMLAGSIVVNFIVSFSMKKLLEAIRVLQIIAFFTFLEINFTPISMLFLQSLYNFTTFKVVPEELMDKIMIFFGIKEDP